MNYYQVVFLHLLVVLDKVDKPEASLLGIPVPLAEVRLELLEELVQLSDVLGDGGDGQRHQGQDDQVLDGHVVVDLARDDFESSLKRYRPNRSILYGRRDKIRRSRDF